MKQTRILWDMPITVEVIDRDVSVNHIDSVYDYFLEIDKLFNIFNPDSVMSRINRGEVKKSKYPKEIKEVLSLCELTKKETKGYFDHIKKDGQIDPLGIVKGWAIKNGADILRSSGFKNFFIEAGGDIEVSGKNEKGKPWIIGIRNPFNRLENIKIVHLISGGIATSGSYIRGNHISNPFSPNVPITDIVSLSVIGPNVYEADRFATAAYAMGSEGIYFIEQLAGFEGYVIDNKGIATSTSGFDSYVISSNINV